MRFLRFDNEFFIVTIENVVTEVIVHRLILFIFFFIFSLPSFCPSYFFLLSFRFFFINFNEKLN